MSPGASERGDQLVVSDALQGFATSQSKYLSLRRSAVTTKANKEEPEVPETSL